MSERFLIRFLSDAPSRIEWLCVDKDGSQVGSVGTGSLEEFARLLNRRQVVLLLSGSEVLLTNAVLPNGSARQISHALPFAVEEQLAEDVEQLYFVHGPREVDGKSAVAVVQRDWIHERLQWLEEAGIRPSWVVPESLLLPWEEGSWSFLVENDRIVMRYGESAGLAIAPDLLSMLLPRLIHEQKGEESIKARVWINQADDDLPDIFSSLNIECEQVLSLDHGLLAFRQLPQKMLQLDLLRVVKRDAGQIDRQVGVWRLAGALALLAVFVHLGVSGYYYWQLQQEQALLENKILASFQEAFPKVRRVVDPLVQAEQMLRERRTAGGQGDDAFLGMLYQLGDELRKQRTLKLAGLEFRDGLMQVQIKAGSVSQIEELKKQLEQEDGLQAEILSAVSRDKGIDAKLRMKREL